MLSGALSLRLMNTERIMNKTHWKKAFNKEFLGAHDIDEGQELKVTIKNVIVKQVKDPQGADKISQ